MRFWNILAIATCVVAATIPPRQSTNSTVGNAGITSDFDRAAAIKEAFVHSWEGYKKYAWGYDELLSVSNRGGNSRNGWGASIADALSTACLMELSEVVVEAIGFLAEVDFNTTATEVSLFETTIRYLGGLLSGYDLLKGPYAHLVPEDKAYLVDRLLTQAVSLADRMSFAFDTPTGIPYNNLDFATNSSRDSSNGLATTGTLVLEWTRLSDLTGNPKYARLSQRAQDYLLNPLPDAGQPFAGMLGTNIDIASGRFLDSSGGWSGGTDSFYEYLLKMWIYSPSRFGSYASRWLLAADSTVEHLLQRPRRDTTFVAEYRDAATLVPEEGHLTCFIGGNLALGGALLSSAKIRDAGLELTRGCRATYASTASGIGPERWAWSSPAPVEHQAFFAANGWYPTGTAYHLRPEVVESYYHALLLTGDQKYKRWAWDAFVAINDACRTDSGYSSVEDVMLPLGGEKTDFQESFWFAEVLKYLYLVFDDSEVSVQGGSGWVFNTEAHPLRVTE